MDQIKIGKFIASCRKAQGMTQAALAERLGISDRAVSKWENGRSVPDAGIMLELCDLLEINVNELLSGEHLTAESRHTRSEELILDLKAENERYAKRLLHTEIYFLVLGTAAGLVLMAAAAVITLKYGDDGPLAVALVALGCVIVAAAALTGTGIEVKTGYYKCSECGHIYKPSSYMKTAFAVHMNSTRYMRCPKCGKRGWQRKVLSKDE